MSPFATHRRPRPRSPAPLPGHRQITAVCNHGFTITELLVVVVIIGLLAVVATPALRSSDPHKLDLAATKVAEAIRLARSESMRTGEVYGITISQASQQVRVRRYDITADPVNPLETLYHPVDKQLLDFDFDELATTQGVRINNTQDVFDYPDAGRRRTVLFDRQGVPVWILAGGSTIEPLTQGIVELSLDASKQAVQIAPFTGRVTIQ